MIRVVLPAHLKTLARVSGEVQFELPAPVTLGSVIDAIEAFYPTLDGTIRDHVTRKRRPFIRFFACREDISLGSWDQVLPEPVLAGAEPLLVVGAMAGG